jgi:TIR domain/PAN domain
MAGKIFINYRRDDSISTAGRLHDRLAQTFGRKNLFMDVDHIPAGVDFVEYLNSQVTACDVFLAIIGPNWLDSKDDDGRRRFDNPDDFVTIEIAAALARKIRVIPVLVDGARTPKADRLPDSVKPLVRRNAVEVRNTHFGRDAEALANKIGEALQDAQPVKKRWPFLASGAAWLMVPGRWRTVAGSTMALLLVGWIGLYQVGVPVWVPWAEQPDPARGDKAKAAADAEAQRKATEAELQRMKDEVEHQAKAAADAEAKLKAAEAEQQRLKDEEQRQAKAAADAEAKRKAAEAEQQRLAAIKEEEQRQAKAADVEAKLKAAEAEQQRLKEEVQRQAKAAADAEAKRKAAEAEQQRLKEEQQRQAKAAADAEAKRKAAEVEQQRLAAVKAEEERKAKAEAEAAAKRTAEEAPSTASFEKRSNMKASGALINQSTVSSIEECEKKCTLVTGCKVFTLHATGKWCDLYSYADLEPNPWFDAGVRIEQSSRSSDIKNAPPASPAMPPSAAGLFTIRKNTAAAGYPAAYPASWSVPSISECEQKCAQSPRCKIFTYNKSTGICDIYSDATFNANEQYDSGIRK